MSELARKLAGMRGRIEPIWDDARARRVADGIAARKQRQARARSVRIAAFTVACLVAGALAVRHAATLATLPPARPSEPATIRFADGSTARLLDFASEVRTLPAPPHRMLAEVVRGGARFDVVRNPERVFAVRAGAVSVEVLGTGFVVERRGGRVRVGVDHGRVRVAWPGGKRELTDGQSDQFPPEVPSPAVAETVPWKSLAERGEYERAFAALRDSELRDEPGELLLAADVARLSHHPGEAVAPLRQILEQHRGDARASLAAFTLGRVLLEDLDRPRDAALAFAQSRSLDARGPLAEDALAREVEAWSRAGRIDRARLRAAEYLRSYPEGPRLGSVRRYGSP